LRLELGQVPDDSQLDDLAHVPAVGERVLEFLLRHAARTEGSRLTIAETEEMQHTAALEGRRQAGDVNGSLGVVEDMEHAAVECGSEAPTQRSEVERVGDEEVCRPPAFGGLPLGRPDRLRRGGGSTYLE